VLFASAVAIGFRVAHLELMEFRLDSAYWALEGLDIVRGTRFPLVGQQVGSVSVPMFNGPFLSYLVAATFALFGVSAVHGALAIGVLSGLAVGVTFWLGKELYSPRVGLMAAAFVGCAPWLVLYGRMLWPQSLFPALVPLSLFTLHRAISSRANWAAVCWGILVGIGAQLHLSALALVPAGLISLVIFQRRAAPVAWAGAGLAIGYSPVLINDVLAGWPNTLGLLSLAGHRTGQEETGLIRAAKWLWNLENMVSGQGLWWSKLGVREAYLPGWLDWGQGIAWALLAGMAGVGLLGWVWRSIRGGGALHRGDVIAIGYVMLPLAYLLLAGGPVLRHYFLVVLPIAFLLIARGIAALEGRAGLIAGGIAAVCLMMNLATNVHMLNYLSMERGGGDYGPVLEDKAEAVAWITNEGNKAFSVDVSASGDQLAYSFLFEQQLSGIRYGPEGTIAGPDGVGAGPGCILLGAQEGTDLSEGLDVVRFGHVRIVQLRPGCRSGA
jgi:hypothetical protein